MTATPNQFSSTELADMRQTQDEHMLDLCHLYTASESQDGFGELDKTDTEVTAGADTLCGLDMRPGSERHGTEKTVVTYDATLRLPIGTTVNMKTKIKVHTRFGEALSTPLIFDIVSPPQRGASGIRVLLKRVEV